MSNKKKILILIAILFILFLIIISTYSKYVSNGNAIISKKIGQWIIKINGQDITENVVNNFEIDNFTWDWESNKNVKKPKVAPGMKGKFTLKVDPTGTDTSIKYTITMNKSAFALIANINLKITKITENGINKPLTEDADGNIVIEKIKTLDKIKSENATDRIDNLQVEVTWENDDTEYGNKQDSIVGSTINTKIVLPIKVNVIQYTGDI